MRMLLAVLVLLVVACSSPAPSSPNLGVADARQYTNQTFTGPNHSIGVVGTMLHFHLSSRAAVLVVASVSFKTESGHGYVYPNLEIDGSDGGPGGISHHFATTDNDSEGGGAWMAATWVRVEQLSAGQHTARLTIDVDPETTATVFTGSVRAIRLSG